ncbi:MAG: hypothetical protein PHU25_14620 [Deltaproteobacteria bacterium]|nr:hypothetical protein [Deltaproteobacteria bacterium]
MMARAFKSDHVLPASAAAWAHAGRALLLAAFPVLSACSSSGTSGGGDDAGQSTDGTDTGSVGWEQACDAEARLNCAIYTECAPYQFIWTSLDECLAEISSACVEATKQAPYGPEWLKESIDCQIEAAAGGTPCFNGCAAHLPLFGDLGPGAACPEDFFCDKGLRCSGLCGECIAQLGLDEPCEGEGQCDAWAGLHCDSETKTCRPLPTEGEACGAVYCSPLDPLLNCDVATGTCQRVGTGPGSDCVGLCTQGNLYCGPDKKCDAPLGLGASCDPSFLNVCDISQGLVCDQTSHTCTYPWADVGEPCPNGLCWRSFCATPGDGGPAACVPYLKRGDPCSSSGVWCAMPYACVSGVCDVSGYSPLPTCS